MSKSITEGLIAPMCAQNCSHAHHEEEEEEEGDEKEEEPVEEVEEEPEEEIEESDVEMDEQDVVVPDDAPPQQVRGHGASQPRGSITIMYCCKNASLSLSASKFLNCFNRCLAKSVHSIVRFCGHAMLARGL